VHRNMLTVWFGSSLQDDRHLDFTDPHSVMQLTKTLLRQDFNLHIDLPPDRLCPPVPNRHNYVLWLKSLLDSTAASYADQYEPRREVLGLDIGTGSSAIYPLLGCAQRSNWKFIGTDIDDKSLGYARRNVETNGLESRIRVVERSPGDPLVGLDELEAQKLDFTMTNPPFYESEAELLDLAARKSKPPNTVCTGAANEMVVQGGEVGFVLRVIEESLVLRESVGWYTSMLGKQSSLETLVAKLVENDIDNYALAEFVQGSKTKRWAIGWSFSSRRPSVEASRGFEPAAGKKILPPVTEFLVATKLCRKGQAEGVRNVFWAQLEDVTEGLDLISWNLDEDRLRVVGFADENVWSRAYRREKERRMKVGEGDKSATKETVKKTAAGCAFGFSIALKTARDQSSGQDKVTVLVRWLQGHDYGLFESFAGMLKNALQNVV
jgi:23S rRNA (adenine1618-N6)-methyltransferase